MSHRNLNPNQFALPGMEDVSHPGAKLLSQGYHFMPEHGPNIHYDFDDYTSHETNNLRVRDKDDMFVGSLSWNGRKKTPGYNPGEIKMIHVAPEYQRKGIATAMFGVARNLPKPFSKAQHSPDRTEDGEAWARTTKAKGVKLPKSM